MDFRNELHNGFSEFLNTIQADNETDILLLPYAEYSLQCFVIYHKALYTGLLREGGPLAQAFCALGIDQPRDQLVIFLEHFYIYWRTQQENP